MKPIFQTRIITMQDIEDHPELIDEGIAVGDCIGVPTLSIR